MIFKQMFYEFNDKQQHLYVFAILFKLIRCLLCCRVVFTLVISLNLTSDNMRHQLC